MAASGSSRVIIPSQEEIRSAMPHIEDKDLKDQMQNFLDNWGKQTSANSSKKTATPRANVISKGNQRTSTPDTTLRLSPLSKESENLSEKQKITRTIDNFSLFLRNQKFGRAAVAPSLADLEKALPFVQIQSVKDNMTNFIKQRQVSEKK